MTNNFSDLRHPKAGIAALRYVYHNADGDPVLVVNRYHKADGSKFFLPFDVTQGTWKAPETRPLYNLDRIAQAHPSAPVVLVEGEKCADALTGLGYLATATFGGCNALAKTDLAPLARRNVTVWPDLDEPGAAYAKRAALALRREYEAAAGVIPVSADLLRKVTLGMAANDSASSSISSACCVESTTASISAGRPPTYRNVTWAFASGRSQGKVPSFRTSTCLRISLWANMIGAGISSGVSSQAYPNIRP